MAKNKNHSELSKEDFERYLKSDKSGKEAHELEKAVLDSDFDSDALDGLESISADTAIADLKILESRLAEKRKSFGFWKMAAAISLLLISSAVIWRIVDQIKEPEQLSMSEEKEQEEPDHTPPISQNEEVTVVPNTSSQPTTNNNVEKKIIEKAKSNKIPSVEPTPIPSTEQDTEDIASFTPENTEVKTEEISNELNGTVDNQATLDSDIAVADEEAVFDKIEDIELEVQEEKDFFIEEKVIANAPTLSNRKLAKRETKARSEAIPSAVPTTSRRITGIVSDKELDEPIPGVTVIEKGTSNGTITNIDGTYSLELENPSNSELAFESIGYVTNETKIDSEDQVDIALDADITSLSEIVVIGYGTDSSEPIEPSGYISPNPIGGKKSFDEYIAQNKKYPINAQNEATKGRVVLKLTIDMYGVLSEVIVTKSLGNGCDEEAIRLIKNWTGWEPAELDGKPIASKIKIRIRFP